MLFEDLKKVTGIKNEMTPKTLGTSTLSGRTEEGKTRNESLTGSA
jgi:hypothetical protein